MERSAGPERPLSPPHSNHGDLDLLVLHQPKIEPCTPPRSIRPALGGERAFVREPAIPDRDRDSLQQSPYGDPTLYHTTPTQMYYSQEPTFSRIAPYHTPPAAIPEAGIQTRSGRALGSPMSPRSIGFPGRSASPKPKRQKAPKPSKKGAPVIQGPLSVLTKDYEIPVRDMGAWVHRSIEQRMQEVEKKKGYVSRPMNSFMLYRSAYAERVKQFCKENNHQVVSQATGSSWPLEPDEVRHLYEKYATIERDNHAAAHPDYKFAPNKNGKKRAFVDDEASDDDPDWEGSNRHTKRSRTTRHEDSRSLSSTPFEGHSGVQYSPSIGSQLPLHPSSYEALNPYGPPPMVLAPDGMGGHYYHPTIVPYGQRVDDIRFGHGAHSLPQYDYNNHLTSMPGAQHHDLLQLQPDHHIQHPAGQDLLDPRLAQLDGNYQYSHYDNVEQGLEIPRTYYHGAYPHQSETAYQQEIFHPGMATLTDGGSGWMEPGQPGSEFDHEFQKWN